MSTDQPTLGEFDAENADARADGVEVMDGAKYRHEPAAHAHAGSGPRNACLNCDKSINRRIARVIGDNDGCVKRCVDCWVRHDGRRYESTATAMKAYRYNHGQEPTEARNE